MQKIDGQEYYTRDEIQEMGFSGRVLDYFQIRPDLVLGLTDSRGRRIRGGAERHRYVRRKIDKLLENKNIKKQIRRLGLEVEAEKFVAKHEPVVEIIPFEEAKEKAIKYHNDWRAGHGRTQFKKVDEKREFLRKIMHNWIRHHLTDYDSVGEDMFVRFRTRKFHHILKNKYNKAVYRAYPDLKQP